MKTRAQQQYERMALVLTDAGVRPREIVAELSKRLGVSTEAIYKWQHGRTKDIGSNILERFSRLHRVRLEWLASGRGDKLSGLQLQNDNWPAQSQPVNNVPLIDKISAGKWVDIVDTFDPGQAEQYIPTTATVSESAFALEVEGDSMTSPTGRSIPEGAYVVVDPDVQPENGSIVVAKLPGSDQVTIKKLVKDGGSTFLKPLNPAYPAVPIDDECLIVGVVKQAVINV